MIIKDNNNLRRTIVDLVGIYDSTVMWLIGGILSQCKTPEDWMHAKRSIVTAFHEGYGDELRGDSPFMDARVRWGLCRINRNLFPPDAKFEYPSLQWQDVDFKEANRALNINVCRYMIEYIMDEDEVFGGYMAAAEEKERHKIIKALQSEIRRLQEVEIKSDRDICCSGGKFYDD